MESLATSPHVSEAGPAPHRIRQRRRRRILAYPRSVLMENRNGLVRDACLTRASGTAERDATLTMLDRRKGERRITRGADKGYDVAAPVRPCNDGAWR